MSFNRASHAVMNHADIPNIKPPLWPQLRRALSGHCPQCGGGKLYKSYLRQVEGCTACGEVFGNIRADDGPAWLTILIVGHIIVPLLLEFEKDSTWPMWVPMVLWPSLAIMLALLLLPLTKAFFITILWRTRVVKEKSVEIRPVA